MNNSFSRCNIKVITGESVYNQMSIYWCHFDTDRANQTKKDNYYHIVFGVGPRYCKVQAVMVRKMKIIRSYEISLQWCLSQNGSKLASSWAAIVAGWNSTVQCYNFGVICRTKWCVMNNPLILLVSSSHSYKVENPILLIVFVLAVVRRLIWFWFVASRRNLYSTYRTRI